MCLGASAARYGEVGRYFKFRYIRTPREIKGAAALSLGRLSCEGTHVFVRARGGGHKHEARTRHPRPRINDWSGYGRQLEFDFILFLSRGVISLPAGSSSPRQQRSRHLLHRHVSRHGSLTLLFRSTYVRQHHTVVLCLLAARPGRRLRLWKTRRRGGATRSPSWWKSFGPTASLAAAGSRIWRSEGR